MGHSADGESAYGLFEESGLIHMPPPQLSIVILIVSAGGEEVPSQMSSLALRSM
jgi:hypothetical protein